jgi:hypothetical protein
MKKQNRIRYFIIVIALIFQAVLLEAHVEKTKRLPQPIANPNLSGIKIPFVKNHNHSQNQVSFYAQTFSGTLFVTKKGELVYHLIHGDTKKCCPGNSRIHTKWTAGHASRSGTIQCESQLL